MVSFVTMAILTLVTLVIPVLGDDHSLAVHCSGTVIAMIGGNPRGDTAITMNAMKLTAECNLARPTRRQKVAFRSVVDKLKVVLHAAGYLPEVVLMPPNAISNEDTLASQCSFIALAQIGGTPNAAVNELVNNMKGQGNCNIPNPTPRHHQAFQNVVDRLVAVLLLAGYLPQ